MKLIVVTFVVLFTLVDCETYCGIKEPSIEDRIHNGWPASSWPWHGALFRKRDEFWEYGCGSSIITNNFVITAAHCTFLPGSQLSESEIIIKVGLTKLDTTGTMVQTLRVSNIIRHENFIRGKAKGHNDIALLELSERISFEELYVQPICLWSGDSNFDKIVHSIGVLAGWGTKDGTYLPSNDLQESTISIVTNELCNATYRYYKNFIMDSSKFCGDHTKGSMSSKGDSGGGLYLKIGNTWFLRGILSVGISGSYDMFMDVAYFQNWIERHVPGFRTIFPVVKATNQCGFRRLLSFHNDTFSIGWPWHGAMFHRSPNDELTYQCGVTILTEFYVVSAAHCTLDKRLAALHARKIFVKVGLTKLDATHHVQLLRVAEVKRHEFYAQHKHEDDIVLLRLQTKILFDDEHVRPICLWNGEMWLKNVVNKTGYIAGWGRNEHGHIMNELQEASMPIVSRKACLDSDPEHFDLLYRDPKTFCAGTKNGTNAGAGDSGGGLYLKIGDQWFLRGIVNNIKSYNETIIDVKSYLLLHDIGFYQYWIRDNVPLDQFPPQ